MPTVEIPKPPMWGCDCTDYAYHPHAEQIPARLPGMLKRAAEVDVLSIDKDKVWQFSTQTRGKNSLHWPVYNPQGEGGGLCVHCVACASYIVGEWFNLLIGKENEK